MASGVATIKEVVSGDTFVLVGCPRGGPPPEKRLTLACVRAPRVAMKSFSHEQQDEPYGFISREFMRRKLIGQSVEFQVDAAATSAARLARGGSAAATDTSNERAVGIIKFNGEDVRCALLKNGLAKLDNYAKAIAGTPEVQELEKCQEQAQQEGVGVWNTDAAAAAATVRDIQWALNDSAAVKTFAAAHKNKRVLGLVEYVRDGGCVRVSLYVDPQQQQELEQQQQQQQQQQVLHLKEPLKVMYASVLLSGIQCDGFKREQQDPAAGVPPKIVAEPYAAEARFFVETRLLNREVEVRIEGSDEVGNLYGSLYHPRGNISLLLLQNGLARLNAATVGLTEAAAQMRLAMQEAQQKQLRRWKNWQSSTANVGAKQYTAVVAEVISGDQLLLQLPDGTERRVFLSSIRCLRGTAAAGAAAAAASGPAGAVRGSATLKDEDSMAFLAKEFVRKKILGKKVRVCVDYVRDIPVGGAAGSGEQQQQPMQFVSVYLPGGGGGAAAAKDKSNTNSSEAGTTTGAAAVPETSEGQNIGALLVQQGLAKTVTHRGDDERAKDYETYLELEKGAQQRRVGLHAPQQQWPTFRIVDLTGPANVQRAQAHFQQLEKVPRLECIVDYVFNASRYKLRIPSQNLSISFALSGVRSPQPGPRGWVGGGVPTAAGSSSSSSINSSSSSNASTTNGSSSISIMGGGGGGTGSSRGGGNVGGSGARGREAEPFGDEALAYARSRLLQREVRIKIEAVDKGGNFLGTLWASGGPLAAAQAQQAQQAQAAAAANKQQQPQVGILQQQQQQQQQQGSNFAAELLELGLAHTVEFSLARTPYKDLLIQAEKKAQAARLKIWSLPNALTGADGDAADASASKEIEVDENLPEVIVSHTEKIDCIYIQEAHNKQLEKINQALAQCVDGASAADADAAGAADDYFTPGGPPRRGDLVLAKFTSDGTWYRARIEGTEGGSTGKTSYRVMYIDFGNSEVLPLDHLRKCPSSLRDIPPQAKLCCLSGLLPPPEMDVEAAAFFESLTQDLVFCCSVEKIDTQRRRHVILTPQETSGSGKSGVTINEKMLRQGLARLDKKSKTKIFHRLQLEEQAARKAHINVWRYGDCGADDDDDSFAPLNERSRFTRRA